jgi:dihydrofolate reductase
MGPANLENTMRKLIVAEHISLDGVNQAPGGPGEDTSDGFRFGGWTVPYGDEAIGHELKDLFSQPFALLLGRRTYDIFSGYWPHVPVDSGSRTIADLFNSVPSTWPRIGPIRLNGRTVMRWWAALPTRFARSSSRTATTC